MNRSVLGRAGIVLVALLCSVPLAAGVQVFVDAAPNAYGSPAYAAWEAAAFAAAADGSFVNMASSVNPCSVGTTDFEIEDEVVYSFGDLGRRLTWVYWIPGETVEGLAGRIEVALYNTWDGEGLDFYEYYYGSTWLVPTKIYDYDIDGDGTADGVAGIAGMAWWAAYDVNTPEALEADLAAWSTAREQWEFMVKLDGEITSIVCNRLPVRVTTLFDGCAAGARNRGQFMKCVAAQLQALVKAGVITGREKGKIQSCAAGAGLGD